MSNCVANGLVSVDVQPGDRVTLYAQNCWEWLVAYHASSDVCVIFRFDGDGRIVFEEHDEDALSVMRQLGALPG